MKEAERRGYQVLWVDPIGLRSARLQRKDVAKLTRRLRQFRRPFVRVSDRIWRLAPFGIPLQGTRLGAALNRRLLAACANRLHEQRRNALLKPISPAPTTAFAFSGRRHSEPRIKLGLKSLTAGHRTREEYPRAEWRSSFRSQRVRKGARLY
jgi:hypothetical protein